MASAVQLSMILYNVLTTDYCPSWVSRGTGCLGVARTRYAAGALCPATQSGYVTVANASEYVNGYFHVFLRNVREKDREAFLSHARMIRSKYGPCVQ